jgi:Protein of unknown function (DUF3102)
LKFESSQPHHAVLRELRFPEFSCSNPNKASERIDQPGPIRDDICNIIRRGELLQQAKDQVEHGGWLTWLETNFNWDEEMAQRDG